MTERMKESMNEKEVEEMMIKQEIDELGKEINMWPEYEEGELEWLAKRDWMKMKEEEYEAGCNKDFMIRLKKYEKKYKGLTVYHKY